MNGGKNSRIEFALNAFVNAFFIYIGLKYIKGVAFLISYFYSVILSKILFTRDIHALAFILYFYASFLTGDNKVLPSL
jgi:hypothetical protein